MRGIEGDREIALAEQAGGAVGQRIHLGGAAHGGQLDARRQLGLGVAAGPGLGFDVLLELGDLLGQVVDLVPGRTEHHDQPPERDTEQDREHGGDHPQQHRLRDGRGDSGRQGDQADTGHSKRSAIHPFPSDSQRRIQGPEQGIQP